LVDYEFSRIYQNHQTRGYYDMVLPRMPIKMKYVEIGAIYKVQIPKDFSWGDNRDEDLSDYRGYWNELEIEISSYFPGRSAPIIGKRYLDSVSYRVCCIEEEWLGELVRHCPQVEHYIKSQEKEEYISLITGKKV
jgi:hypothetical protein